jgi:hypothetical protein
MGEEIGSEMAFRTFGHLVSTLCGRVSRDSVVNIVTRYGLDGLGIESWWGRDFEIFCTLPYWPWGSASLLYKGYWVFPGGKVAGV